MDSSPMDEHVSQSEKEHEFEQAPGDPTKLVPVGESIRYRKRAQSAEKQAQELADQLARANERLVQMSDQMDTLHLDRKLTRQLTAAGAIDLEAAALVAKSRMADKGADSDIGECVEQLRTEKPYLFGRSSEAATSRKTAGAKDRVAQNRTALQQAAAKAARTGQRADLQAYLKLRRSLL